MPLRGLNQEQKEAATAPLGANLVIASAGTGKTSTIVGRIAHLLHSGIPPQEIVLLTFTNKAAHEMIARLRAFFPNDTLKQIEAGTFHAVAYRWLKKYEPSYMLKQPSELRTLFRSIYQQRQWHRIGAPVDPFSPSFLYEKYNLWQNGSHETFGKWFLNQYPEHELLIDAYCDLIDEYESQKKAFKFVSFNDLLLEAIALRKDLTETFTEVLVDEYQDTNPLQSHFIDTIGSRSLFCVGDYDQSIYAFNGADIRNIATFQTRYKHANIYTLQTNYRSGGAILSLADRVISRNERLYPKKLVVGKKGKSNPPKLLVYRDLYEQYRTIAQHIKDLNVAYDDVAVLFRNNASADGIEAALREKAIACRRKGGAGFFETKEVKFLLDFLSLLINENDMMACIHIFEYAPSIGSALAKELYENLSYLGKGSFHKGLLSPVHENLLNPNSKSSRQLGLFFEEFSEESAQRFGYLHLHPQLSSHPILKHPKLTEEGVMFLNLFVEIYATLDKSQSASLILQSLINSSLYRHIIQILSKARAKLKNGEIDTDKQARSKERIERKARLLLELSKPYRDLSRFVNAMVLGGGELSEGEGVNLLTVHASKGLEFHTVFVVDLVEGRFPNHKMMTSIEEERRLFYVAVTRAKEQLYLCYAKCDSLKQKEYQPSIFLKEAGLLN